MHRRSFLGLCAASVAAVGLGKFVFSEEKFDDDELARLLAEGHPITGRTFRVSRTIVLPDGAVIHGCTLHCFVSEGEVFDPVGRAEISHSTINVEYTGKPAFWIKAA